MSIKFEKFAIDACESTVDCDLNLGRKEISLRVSDSGKKFF